MDRPNNGLPSGEKAKPTGARPKPPTAPPSAKRPPVFSDPLMKMSHAELRRALDKLGVE